MSAAAAGRPCTLDDAKDGAITILGYLAEGLRRGAIDRALSGQPPALPAGTDPAFFYGPTCTSSAASGSKQPQTGTKCLPWC